jgi:putative DNA primase/helicase
MLWSEPPQHIVNVSNGLLDTRSGTLAPHSPDFLWHVQYSIRFDPEADCPAWTQFLRDILPPDCVETFWDILAWVLFPWVPEQRALLCLGDGSNGKSALLAAIGSLLGPRNVTALSLQKLESDKFALARLAGITANICADLPSEALQSVSVFKAATGDDVCLTAEHKYHKSFEFKPFCRLLFSANLPPRSNDSSSGFWRRWWVINFTREFKAGDPGVLPRNVLDARLADPREKSGVLNKALAALPGVLQRGVRETASMLAAKAEFREVSDALGLWLDEATVEDPAAMIPKSALFNAYLQFCNRRGLAAPTQSSFARSLKRLRPRVEDSRRMIGDKFTHVYVGIRLRAEDYEE